MDKSSKIFSLLLCVILFSSIGVQAVYAVNPLFDFKFGKNGGDGTSGSNTGEFKHPFGVAVANNGNIYVADSSNHIIQIFDSNGVYIRQLGTTGNSGNTQGAAGNNLFFNPNSITIDSADNIWISEAGNHQIVRCDITDTCVLFAGSGVPGFADGIGSAAEFNSPFGIGVDLTSDVIYVADNGNHLLRQCTISNANCDTLAGDNGIGGFTDDPTGVNVLFKFPRGVAVDSSGLVYVSEAGNHIVRQCDPVTTGCITVLGTLPIGIGPGAVPQPGNIEGDGLSAAFNNPRGLAIDQFDNIYVGDTDNHAIRIFDSLFNFDISIGTPGTSGTADGEFFRPYQPNIDGNRIYVADRNNHRIQVFVDNSQSSGSGQAVGQVEIVGGTCGINFPAANTINHEQVAPGQQSLQQTFQIENSGNADAILLVSGTDWEDTSITPLTIMNVDNTRFSTSSGAFNLKTPLTTSNQMLSSLFPPGTPINTYWQLEANLIDSSFTGMLTQTIDFSVTC